MRIRRNEGRESASMRFEMHHKGGGIRGYGPVSQCGGKKKKAPSALEAKPVP